MFELLKDFSKILVTGPQRAGTTICAKMIAVDIGYKFLSQAWLEGNNPVDALRKIWKEDENFVIQCPGEAYIIEQFSADDTLVVFMIRNINDILNSQTAHNWSEKGQKILYNATEDRRPISVIKYERWQQQKKAIKHFLEIDYDSLSNHYLFIPKNKRINWHIRQIDIHNIYQNEIMKRL